MKYLAVVFLIIAIAGCNKQESNSNIETYDAEAAYQEYLKLGELAPLFQQIKHDCLSDVNKGLGLETTACNAGRVMGSKIKAHKR